MRFTNLIIIHCSATRCDRSYTEHDLITDHLSQGFFGAGYHYYICKNGDIKMLRPLEHSEERARGYNAHSIGICCESGLDERGHPADTRTDFQKHSLRMLVMLLLRDYPDSRLCGHRDLSPDLNGNGEIEPEEWIKVCPCFDAVSILQDPLPLIRFHCNAIVICERLCYAFFTK